MLLLSQTILISFAQVLIKTNAYNDADQIKFASIAFLISLLFGGLIKAYSFFSLGSIASTHSESSVLAFTSNILSDWVVTEVRIQVRVLLRLFLFIIPGIIEAVRLSLALPYVFLDKRMKDPHFDPVLESHKRLPFGSPLLIPLFFITLVLPTVVVIITNSDRILFESTTNIGLGVLSAFAQSLAVATAYSYIFNVYLLDSKAGLETSTDDMPQTKGSL